MGIMKNGGDRLQIGTVTKLALAFVLIFIILSLVDAALARRELRLGGETSFATVPTGFRGIHDVLRKLGFSVERYRRTYLSLPRPEEAVLVMLAPTRASRVLSGEIRELDESYPEALQDWVQQGGVVVHAPPGLALGILPGGLLAEPSGEPGVPPDEVDREVRELERDAGRLPTGEPVPDPMAELLQGLPERVWAPVEGTLSDPSVDLTPLDEDLRDTVRSFLEPWTLDRVPAFAPLREDSVFTARVFLDDDPIVLERYVGSGRVVAFSSAYFWTNAAVARTGAAEMVVPLLADVSGGGRRRILFDEFAHGHVVHGTVLQWIWKTDLLYLVVTSLLGVGLFAWAGAIRQGPPRQIRRLPRRAKEEFVVSLADLYQRAGRPRLAARRILRAYEEEIGAMMGQPWQAIRGSDLVGELQPLREGLKRGDPWDGPSLVRFAERARIAHGRATRRLRRQQRGTP
jgi:hypothetical protein